MSRAIWMCRTTLSKSSLKRTLSTSPISQVFRAGYIELAKLRKKKKTKEDGDVEETHMGDLESIERRLQNIVRKVRGGDKEAVQQERLMKKALEVLEAGQLSQAQHPYTKGLLNCLPELDRPQEVVAERVDAEVVEAGRAFGASRWQLLKDVEIPLALPSIMTGVNQTILMCLSMVVIISLIGGGGLGKEILEALQYAAKGPGLLGGIYDGLQRPLPALQEQSAIPGLVTRRLAARVDGHGKRDFPALTMAPRTCMSKLVLGSRTGHTLTTGH